jgi:hypothetical protein
MVEKLDGELGVIVERIEELRKDIIEIKNDVTQTCKLISDFQLFYTREHAKLEVMTLEMLKDLAKHEVRIETLDALIRPLIFQNKIVASIGGILLLAVVGILVAIFTHQITLVFP